MLAFMKSLMNSFFGKIIVMIIVAGMAFWGVDQMVAQIRGGLGNDLAAAGKRTLGVPEFDRRVETIIRGMNAESDEPVSKSELADQGMIDQVFLMETSKLTALGYARSIGVRPSAEAVIEELKTVDAFKNPLTGALDLDTYRDTLYRNQISQADYEQQVSDEIILKALTGGAAAAIYPPKTLTDLQARFIGEARDISWFVLDTTSLPKPDAPTEEEIRAYYDENVEALKQPERRMIDMLKMSAADFLSEVTVTEQEVATIYESRKSERYSAPDTRTYLELYFDSRDDARTAVGQLATGADAASLQGVVSRETKTGRKAETPDKDLAEAMFGAGKQSGAVFGPAERGNQWLVARLVSVQPGAVFPLESVEQEIRDELSRERAEVLLYDKMDLLDRAIGAGYPLSQISEEVNVPMITFAPVDANGMTESGMRLAGVVEAGDAFAQAFTIEAGETSNRYDGPDAIYLTSPRKVVAPYTPAFEEIKDRVRNGLVREREANTAQVAIDGIKSRIESGASTLAEEAGKAGSDIASPPTPLTRLNAADSGMPNAAISSVFAGKQGDIITLPSRAGDVVMIMQIKSVTPPDEAGLLALAPRAASALSASLEEDLNVAIQAEISAKMKLRTNKAAINAYKASISSDQ